MKSNRVPVMFMLAVLMLVTVGGLSTVLGQDAVAIPEVMVSAGDDEVVDFPAVVPEGVVQFTFENNRAEMPYSPIIARLNDGVTMDQFNESMASDDEFAALALVTLYGGSEVAPGESGSFWLDMLPGSYVVVEFSEAGPPSVEAFDVEDTDGEVAEGPETNVTVAMVDFAFGVPLTQQAGEQVWRLMNVGNQWHEMGVFKVDEGTTIEQVQELLMAAFGSEDENAELPFEPAFFWAPMGPDATAWVTVDLEPGSYAVVCFLPDLLGDFSPHVMKGMIQIFTVE